MSKTLLLADDSVVIQKLVGLSFANEDVEIITADNGDDAIARALESMPDVVIADVIMPGKSGYEVCEAIKASPALAHIPVLLLTGTFEAFDEERSRAVGSVGHITKPFEAQALVARVKALFSGAPSSTPPRIPAPDLEITEEAPVADDAFDFFDDDVSDLSNVAPASVAAAMRPDPLADPFSADSDDPFGDLSESSSHVGRADLDGGLLGSDSTVALMPDSEGDSATELPIDLVNLDSTLEEDFGSDAIPTAFLSDAADPMTWVDEGVAQSPAETVLADFGEFGEPGGDRGSAATALRADADDLSVQETMSAMDVSDDFEFGSNGDSVARNPEQTHLADELFSEPTDSPATIGLDFQVGSPLPDDFSLDPNEDLLLLDESSNAEVSMNPGSSAFDISSSDLGDLDLASSKLAPAEPAPASFESPADDGFDLPPAIETRVAEPISDGRSASAFGDLLDARAVQPLGSDDGFSDDDFMRTDTLSGPSFAAASVNPVDERVAEDSDPSAPFFAPAVAEVAAAPPAFAPTERSDAAVDITPLLQQRLHETLEKVAWEAFSELSEQVVKQVLERVESIAWEVIPQMTEALVREEIRKMKGEDESGE